MILYGIFTETYAIDPPGTPAIGEAELFPPGEGWIRHSPTMWLCCIRCHGHRWDKPSWEKVGQICS